MFNLVWEATDADLVEHFQDCPVGRLYVFRLKLELGVSGNVSNPESTAPSQSRLNLLNDFSCMSAHMLKVTPT